MFLSVFLVSCGAGFKGQQSSRNYWLPWPDAQGRMSFQWVNISTLNEADKLEGVAARVFWRGGLADGGFTGPVASPRIASSSSGWLPLDANSAQLLSLYAIFERLYFFERDLNLNMSLPWPRQVGAEINLNFKGGQILNNAMYIPSHGVIAITPYTWQNRALTLNHGVIAHEHFHAHFANYLKKAGHERGSFAKASAPRVLAKQVILAAWDEGLADYYAFAFSRRQDFLHLSVPQLKESRRLDGPLYSFINESQLVARFACEDVEQCLLPQRGRDLFYYFGTLMARVLYRWGEELGGGDHHPELLARVMESMPRFMMTFSLNSTTESLAFEDFLIYLLDERKSLALPTTLCLELASFVTSQQRSRLTKTCGL